MWEREKDRKRTEGKSAEDWEMRRDDVKQHEKILKWLSLILAEKTILQVRPSKSKILTEKKLVPSLKSCVYVFKIWFTPTCSAFWINSRDIVSKISFFSQICSYFLGSLCLKNAAFNALIPYSDPCLAVVAWRNRSACFRKSYCPISS